jgi:outer membrane immunogenic protein
MKQTRTKVPAYWVVNLNSSYKTTQNIELFGLVRNLFNRHYFVSGAFFETDSFPYLNLTDPRTFVPGMPFAAYVGVRGTLPTGGGVFAAAPIVTKTRQTIWASTASPATNWTGVYLGVNGGYTFGGSKWSDSVTGNSSGSFGTSGFIFGGTVGANYQVGSLVFGVEGDGGWADASGFGTFTATSLCAAGCLTRDTWLSTARGRVGYAFDRYLVFAAAGAAFGDIRANFSNGPISRSTEAGWTIGAGIEVALGRNWSAKAEYLFVDLADGSCTTACTIANPNGPALVPNVAVKFDESIVRAGVNYRFGL